MKISDLRYLTFAILPLSVGIAFIYDGILTFLPLLVSFGVIPLVELMLPKNETNASEEKEKQLLSSPFFDWAIYLAAFSQFGFLIWYFKIISIENITTISFWGKSISMGLMCGVIGINVAHELGHRVNKGEQFLAKALLTTSLYTHFYIEHNRGHHRNVSTPEDPASARLGENLYQFWWRSILFSYLSAWKLENKRLQRIGINTFSLKNEMIQYLLLNLTFITGIYLLFGRQTLLGFLLAAVVGILLLETVNYIEHYGLQRKKITDKRYEKAGPEHSWNSDHLIGRSLLFELSRHSDHHYQPNRKYQVLRHFSNSPQMPTGYPGMMLLSIVPPIWFKFIHKHMATQEITKDQLKSLNGIY